MGAKINIGDTWKDVTDMKINIGDTWKDVVSAKINIGDDWKEWHSVPQFRTTNLVGRYLFEDNLNDSYGTNHLSARGTQTYRTGVSGKAHGWLDSTSYNTYAYLLNSTIANYFTGTKAWSVSIWARRVATDCVLLCSNSSGATRMQIYVEPDSKYLYCRNSMYYYGTTITITDFNHFGFTYTGSAMKFYVNGVLKSTVTDTASIASATCLSIHARGSGTANPTFTCRNWDLDMLYIYNTAIADSDMEQLYNGGAGV